MPIYDIHKINFKIVICHALTYFQLILHTMRLSTVSD